VIKIDTLSQIKNLEKQIENITENLNNLEKKEKNVIFFWGGGGGDRAIPLLYFLCI